MTDDAPRPATASSATEPRPVSPAARRALAEAEARRLAAEASAKPAAKELQGPKGPEPTRYGDWENERHRLGLWKPGAASSGWFKAETDGSQTKAAR